MTNKTSSKESAVNNLKNEAVRQRWEMFHRAIAYAKEFNNSALEAEEAANDPTSSPPHVSIIS